ncbi:MAG: pirin family protein [Sarcina sp.]
MIKKIENKNMGKSNLGWLKSSFHFSFAEYYNPSNMGFGKLRVINDDLIAPQTGFPSHPHRDMEIFTYVIDGKLTHKDSMGNERSLERGEVQYMSAGTGVVHSEYNNHDEMLRLLQIWIYPDKRNYDPNYGDVKFKFEDRHNKWLHMVSSCESDAPIKIHQDVNINALYLDEGKVSDFKISPNRQAYLVQIEGTSKISGIDSNETVNLGHGDALEIIGESISLDATSNSHFLILEMKKEF